MRVKMAERAKHAPVDVHDRHAAIGLHTLLQRMTIESLVVDCVRGNERIALGAHEYAIRRHHRNVGRGMLLWIVAIINYRLRSSLRSNWQIEVNRCSVRPFRKITAARTSPVSRMFLSLRMEPATLVMFIRICLNQDWLKNFGISLRGFSRGSVDAVSVTRRIQRNSMAYINNPGCARAVVQTMRASDYAVLHHGHLGRRKDIDSKLPATY